jgi:hypothetical protein
MKYRQLIGAAFLAALAMASAFAPAELDMLIIPSL